MHTFLSHWILKLTFLNSCQRLFVNLINFLGLSYDVTDTGSKIILHFVLMQKTEIYLLQTELKSEMLVKSYFFKQSSLIVRLSLHNKITLHKALHTEGESCEVSDRVISQQPRIGLLDNMGSVLLSLKGLAYRLCCIQYKRRFKGSGYLFLYSQTERRGSLAITLASYTGRRGFEFPLGGHVRILKGVLLMVILNLSGRFMDNKPTTNSVQILSSV